MADVRSTDPNATRDRRGQFRRGWHAAAAGELYSDKTLSQVTWNNLGWRLGSAIASSNIGSTSDALVDAMYDWCVDQQKESGATIADD